MKWDQAEKCTCVTGALRLCYSHRLTLFFWNKAEQLRQLYILLVYFA